MLTDHWVGKDLARAADELEFYQKAFEADAARPTLRGRKGWQLLRWLFDYGGIAEFNCEVGTSAGRRRLLVLRNLFSGFGKMRLLDIKLGAVTAVANWRGKTRIGAAVQIPIDKTTNSYVEGYRTEGFSAMPQPLEQLLTQGQASMSPTKKLFRLRLQRLTTQQFLQWWTELPVSMAVPGGDMRLSSAEVGAVALRSAAVQLCSIAADALALPVPQQWIGSSVGIGFDMKLGMGEGRPLRGAAAPRVAARVCLFDWGRAMLLSPDDWDALPAGKKAERIFYWEQWLGASTRLAFEAVRAYRRRYCPARGWATVCFRLWDHNVGRDDDPIGETEPIPMQATNGEKGLAIVDYGSRAPIAGAVLVVRVEAREDFPEGSELRARHVVRVLRANRLPKKDVFQHCDPCVTVCVRDAEGSEVTAQTSVMSNTADADWSSAFEFGEAWDASADVVVPRSLRHPIGVLPSSLHEWDLPAYAVNGARTPTDVVDRALTAFQNAIPDHNMTLAVETVLVEPDGQRRLGLLFHPPSSTYVSEVLDGGPAARAGFRPGCYIVSIDGHSISSIQEYNHALAGGGSAVVVGVSTQPAHAQRAPASPRPPAQKESLRRLSKAWK